MDKVRSLADALDQVRDHQTVMIGGFGPAGCPVRLVEALAERGLRGLTVISNNAGGERGGIAELLLSGAVAKVVCSFPRQSPTSAFEELYSRGRVELELVPQGTLVERIRSTAAGVGGFYTRTAVGTQLAAGKETRELDGQTYLLERPLPADVALVHAERADRWGNLTYRKAARNLNPVMAAAARTTIAEVDRVVPLGELDPEQIATAGIFVDLVVEVGDRKVGP